MSTLEPETTPGAGRNDSTSTTESERGRTKTRLRGVAPVEVPESPTAPPAIGRYEVIEVIGRGAMGVVYKARDPLLDRVVAVKTIVAPKALGKSVRKAFLERFEREAKAAARISHPAIVTIFDVGLTSEAPFLVMEYLPGETLADRLDRMRMPLGQAVQCAKELASALGHAHRERIVHRDVKPANVLHAGDTRWKLADFGIARLPDSDLTQIGMFMGTPGYAPPEAIREGRYTVQADVFAWGAVFYELICGKVPYEGPDTSTTNGYVLKNEAPSPRTYDASVPDPLAEVALRALAHDPAKRYKNGADAEKALTEAWERCLAGGLVPLTAFASSAEPPPPPQRRAAPPPAAAAPAMPRPTPPPVPPQRPTPAPPGVPIVIAGKNEVSEKLMVAAAMVSAQGAQRADSAQVIRTSVPPERRAAAAARLWLVVLVALTAAGVGAVLAFYLMQ